MRAVAHLASGCCCPTLTTRYLRAFAARSNFRPPRNRNRGFGGSAGSMGKSRSSKSNGLKVRSIGELTEITIGRELAGRDLDGVVGGVDLTGMAIEAAVSLVVVLVANDTQADLRSMLGDVDRRNHKTALR